MLWFDAHLDLAYLAVNGRDMTAPLEVSARPHPPAAITLPSLHEGDVRCALATIFTEPDGKGPEGYSAGDAERAFIVGRAQLEVYQTWRERGLVRTDLDTLMRIDTGVGEIRAGMGVAEVVPKSLRRRISDADRQTAARDSHPWDDRPVSDLKFSVRAHNCLEAGGIRNVRELRNQSTDDLLELRAFGRTSLAEVIEGLRRLGTTLRSLPLHIGILIENADPIRSPDDLPWWKQRGVCAIGLAWAKPSRYAGGNSTDLGLTDLGRALVRAMDQLNIVHDASHLSDRAFRELCELTDKPIIASHSNCRALLGDPSNPPNQRHLTDDHIREIARRGGIIGLNLFSKFLATAANQTEPGSENRATIAEALAHIDHICTLTGSRTHIGLGSDMDGGFGADRLPEGINRPRDLALLTDGLRARGWSAAEIDGFTFVNWARFWGSIAMR